MLKYIIIELAQADKHDESKRCTCYAIAIAVSMQKR